LPLKRNEIAFLYITRYAIFIFTTFYFLFLNQSNLCLLASNLYPFFIDHMFLLFISCPFFRIIPLRVFKSLLLWLYLRSSLLKKAKGTSFFILTDNQQKLINSLRSWSVVFHSAGANVLTVRTERENLIFSLIAEIPKQKERKRAREI